LEPYDFNITFHIYKLLRSHAPPLKWLNEKDCERYGFRPAEVGIGYVPLDLNIIGAVWTLKYRIGVCGDLANLAVALLRAQGIPARYVYGLITDPDNPGLIEADVGHAWVQLYYPELGWIDYDSTRDAVMPLRHHIVFEISPDSASGQGVADGPFTEKWQAVGLGNERVKLTYSVIVTKR